MNFELTEEQLAIRDAVREFCEKEFTDELMRECCENEEYPWGLHRKAAKLGFIGIHFLFLGHGVCQRQCA